AAFAALVRRHGTMVHAVCRRVLRDPHAADDVFQATFLALASRAGNPSWRESVGGWLHVVAHRLALRAPAHARRRRRYEDRAGASTPGDPLEEITGRELCVALDEELGHLPVHCRAPLVLCCLEGATRDEAAQRLGWSLAMLKRRLARGRALLHDR